MKRRRPTPFRPTAQAPLEALRPSAAVLLTRGLGPELEVYLVHRSPKLRAFPDTWALPGGVVDEVDGDPALGDLDVFRRCALRELFEETGVAGPGLARSIGDPGRRDALRRSLVQGQDERDGIPHPTAPAQWARLVSSVDDALQGLEPFCWTVTPNFLPRRYRALYVHLELPVGEQPTIHPGELEGGDFMRPADVWQRWLAGEIKLVPPIVFLLESLRRSGGDLERAKRACEARSAAVDRGALHVVRPVPGIAVAPLATPTIPPATTTNCVLVGEQRVWIVDPATYDHDERDRLLAHLSELRGSGVQLAGVLVTHHHRDHVGSVGAVADVFGLTVRAHARTLERLPAGDWPREAIVDGERIDLGTAPDGSPDWHLRALHTPGHDLGHLVFRESRYGTVVAGDLVSTLSTIVIDPPEGHLATYIESIQRVLGEDPGAIIPAHGGVAHDGARLLEGFLRHRRQREAKLLRALDEGGASSEEELVGSVYDDAPEGLRALAARSLAAGLEKLQEEGRAQGDGAGRWTLVRG
ncbi:MBL fold metallo-hydrolase [Engelhardtia mirabilis]|uniref:Hydroxyacylglutathione hydrolase n=1 Tax=Engelhardtia mirabilis TaxID=2528011 RepID=A0A518BF09_9BACT|nr:Hydroxyacylglutathione hydrolase [Planctomycetes bacterium Pla133]QDU99890.1 Hydroxyacylglutathione hydrolase [Planctomycetes bacterium Pla86]